MAISKDRLKSRIDQALSRRKADLVLKGGRFLNVVTGEVAEGDVAIAGDRIVGTYERYDGEVEIDARGLVAAPGLIDTHVHVESTMVTPAEFDRCVLPRGTTTAVCDPHEVANVLGLRGLRWFLDHAERTTMDLRVQLSSCVPATALETSGARLTAEDLLPLRGHPKVIGLAEMMNFPGVLHHDDEVLDKLVAFDGAHVDGHCPLVTGKDLNAYASCGIRNCHESTRPAEALEKLRKGMQVLLRDGSVSKDVRRLAPLLTEANSPFFALCTDDRNPLDIAEEGHVDHLVRTAIAAGAPLHAVYRAATWSAARGFGLTDRGLVAPGYRADLVLLEDLPECRVRTVIKDGRVVDAETFASAAPPPDVGRDSVRLPRPSVADFRAPAASGSGPVIGLIPGSILTDALSMALPCHDGERRPDPAQDVLQVCVFARHGKNRNVGRGFVRGFGFREGALASSVGHDSHNVIVVGSSPAEMAAAVGRLVEMQGGFVAVRGGRVLAELPLPLSGLISDRPFGEVRDSLRTLRRAVRDMGCPLAEPFLQLAFLPLPVIPHLKITDMGLVDVDRFRLIAA
jgi:adenine deaminase